MSRDIALNLIDPDPEQPRQHFDQAGIEELAQSMKAKGLVVPILLRPEDDRYIIVHGERRYRAALSLGWETIPAEVRDISPQEARWLSLIENVQRQDLSPTEEARAYRERLAEGITQEELGQRIGKSRTYITQKLRLLKLPNSVQVTIGNALTEGHGRQLLKLEAPTMQVELCQKAISEKWTVSQMQQEVDFALLLSPEEQTELETCESKIEDALYFLRIARKPPNENDLFETALWAEQRAIYLNTLPISSLLERRNDLAEIELRLERALGRVLRELEHGERQLDFLAAMGIDAALQVLKPDRHSTYIVTDVAKKLYRAAPGVKVTPVGMEFPPDLTRGQWVEVGKILCEWSSLTDKV